MVNARRPDSNEVEQLLLNARLKEELEPYLDESVTHIDVRRMSTPVENEFLASMLAWERAPAMPISQWFEPELKLPRPDALDEHQLHQTLWDTIGMLFEKQVILEFTDHLTDRQLYCLIYRDILPSSEKKINLSDSYLHWDCVDAGGDPATWLRYYASEEERRSWAQETDQPLPPSESPPYPRKTPRRPL